MKINISTTKEVELSDSLIEKIKEKLKTMPAPEIYWDYREELSTEQIAKILSEKEGLNDVENEIFENNLDYGYDMEIEHLKDALGYFKTELEEELGEEPDLEELSKELRDEFLDYLSIDINFKGLLRNTSKQTMFYDTGYEMDSESWSWSEARVRLERILIKKHLGLISDNTKSNWDEALDMMIREASYGGQLVIYFYEDIETFMDTENVKTISFKNYNVAIINTGNGSGNDTQLSGAFTQLPFVKENLHLDKTIKYNYTFEVCGMSSDWCSDTDVEVSTVPIENAPELPQSHLAETLERDKKLTAVFKAGGCTFGDMDITRHRRAIYVNEYPCGNKCQDCGTFWID